jgi:hypothetical protein
MSHDTVAGRLASCRRHHANSLSGIARDLELQQRLRDAFDALPDPADADALRGWWATMPQRWEAGPLLVT